MERRPFGKTGMSVGVMGLGTSEIGYGAATQAEIDVLINSALDLGLNVIDTAECYVDSEEKIGRAVSHRRNEYFLFSKTGHSSGFAEPDWDPAMIEKQVDRSLQRLRTDHLDLIQLHSPPLEALQSGILIDVLQRVQEAGKVRFIGCSADGETARFAIECGAFAALQTSVNIADQEAIDLTLPLALQRGMGVIAKRPVANAAWIRRQGPEEYGYSYRLRLEELQYDFLKLDPQSAVGIALRFTLAQPGVHTAIVGTEKPSRFAQNLQALEAAVLSESEMRAIRNRWNEVRRDDWVGQG